jgi:hypothetical protein
VSGFYLIVGILRIRSYFKSKDASDRINNTVLLLHAAAFGLYLVAVFVYYGSTTLHAIFEESTFFELVWEDATIFYIYANFVS